jgi:CMP-N-acetylneuraminic acid synthetase
MGTFNKDDPVLFEMEEFESFDIDYKWQFDFAEAYYTHLT